MTDWAPLGALLAALRTEPSRTGSVIATVYGDAILPRGGALALADLLALMRHLGVADGVVRTAVSRLAADGVLVGRRTGRRSVYALTAAAEAEFRAAVPRIYGRAAPAWDGWLRIGFPESAAERAALEKAGFAAVAPGVLISPYPGPVGIAVLEAGGAVQRVVARAWPVERVEASYAAFSAMFAPMVGAMAPTPLDAMAVRTLTIHAWRRVALRDPGLPGGLLPEGWAGGEARVVCRTIYDRVATASEEWLDGSMAGAGPLPPGSSLFGRFS